jgi:hypothetical protein
MKSWAYEQFGLPGSWINKRMQRKDKNGNFRMSYWIYEIMLDSPTSSSVVDDKSELVHKHEIHCEDHHSKKND